MILLVFLAAVLIIFKNFDNIDGKNSCRLPKRWKTNYDFDYRQRQHEWATLNASIDYYKLVFSWSPTFCKRLSMKQRNEHFQCQSDQMELVVHGLWGQSRSAQHVRHHPRNCRNEDALPLTTIKKHFCLMPDESLIQAEWEKHGTCAFPTSDQYFDTIQHLTSTLKLPDLKKIVHQPSVQSSDVKKLFLEANQYLRSNQIIVQMNHHDLKEIIICYDKKFQFTSC